MAEEKNKDLTTEELLKKLIENYDLALLHPDEADLAHLKGAVLRCLEKE